MVILLFITMIYKKLLMLPGPRDIEVTEPTKYGFFQPLFDENTQKLEVLPIFKVQTYERILIY